jgi:uncharacterized protein YcnI
MRKSIFAVASVAALAIVPAAAAHVSPSPSSAAAGSRTIVGFTIGHGCDGSPTKSVSLKVPDGINSAKPKVKAGWKITVTKQKLDQPIKGAHGDITSRVDTITWTGGTVRDDEFDTFEVRFGMPEKVGTVAFPIVQTCAKGVNRWIEPIVKGQPEPESPAPVVTITKAAAHSH